MDILAMANAVAGAAPMESPVLCAVPGRSLHIDGDFLAYNCAGGEDTPVDVARRILTNKVQRQLDSTGAERCVLHMTSPGSSKGDRYLIATSAPYQAQRVGSKRPKNWQYLRDYIGAYAGGLFTTKDWLDREADDGFGIASKWVPGCVLATKDKDMRMLPGIHLDWDSNEMTTVPEGCYEHEAFGKVFGHKWFLLQLLQGDKADHIPGLLTHPKAPRGLVGEKTAEKFLLGTANLGEGLDSVLRCYQEGMPNDWARHFAEQASLLWMRRDKLAHVNSWLIELGEVYDFPEQVVNCAEAQAVHISTMKKEAEEINAAQGI